MMKKLMTTLESIEKLCLILVDEIIIYRTSGLNIIVNMENMDIMVNMVIIDDMVATRVTMKHQMMMVIADKVDLLLLPPLSQIMAEKSKWKLQTKVTEKLIFNNNFTVSN